MTAASPMALAAPTLAMPGLPSARPAVTTRVLYGDLRTGRITRELPVTGCSWSQVLNDAGGVDQVGVHRSLVRQLGLRDAAAPARSFLAVDQDGRIRQAGPIWKHDWSKKQGRLVLGAAGLWSLWDHRKVLPVLAGRRVQDVTTTLTKADLGGIARGLVALALTHTGGNLPLVLPADRPGSNNTETFPGWQLSDLGEQLRQLTQRETAAPDIRFTPRYTADRLGIEWVMEAGTGAQPLLVQPGDDWVLDTTAPEGPVLDVEVQQDADGMGMRGWVTGNGSESDTLIGTYDDLTLVDQGYPLLEVDESRSSVERQSTLDAHARSLVRASARPVEVWKLTVRAEAAVEMLVGHYARVVVRGDDYLPDGDHRVRIQQISGGLGGSVVLDMYPLKGVL